MFKGELNTELFYLCMYKHMGSLEININDRTTYLHIPFVRQNCVIKLETGITNNYCSLGWCWISISSIKIIPLLISKST